jgi:cellulose synthase/poly-beta-1,6-N-acetylglucosamine synthase-like glycosyltransferase
MKKEKRIRLLNFDKGHSAAFGRNRGTEISNGEILFFLDADNSIDKKFLEKINNIFKKNPSVSAIISRTKNIYTNKFSKALALIAWERPANLKRGIVKSDVKINFYIIKKEPFLKLGMFRDNIKYFDDTDLAHKFYKAGYYAFVEPTLILKSEQPENWKGFYRQYKWAGQGIASLEEKNYKIKKIFYTLAKNLFIVFPFVLMIFNLFAGFIVLGIFLILAYLFAFRTCKNPLYSLLMIPLIYAKNIILLFHIIKFSIFKK